MQLVIINNVGCETLRFNIESTNEVAEIIKDSELEVGDTIKIID